jgi:sigma-B regulation protein RsbU (phosphoserine phosphatase)
MLRSVKSQFLSLILGIIILTSAAITAVTLHSVNRTVSAQAEQEARNLVNLVSLTLDTEYRNLVFHRNFALEQRKQQMLDSVSLILSAIDHHHDLARRGLLPEKVARDEILAAVQGMRYGSNDYFFIYNREYIAISHPDPRVRGTNQSNKPDAKGNIPSRLMMDVARKGGGFAPFWWQRLDGQVAVPKLGYARLYDPWQLMVGTGVYIDDIEAEYRKRLEGIISDLSATLGKVRIAGNGYVFIFDGQKRLIVHPSARLNEAAGGKNPATGKPLIDDLIAAGRNGSGRLSYLWEKPDRRGEFRYPKEALVSYFAPLDWYVAVTVYRDDLLQPARTLLYRQLAIIAVISTLSALCAVILTRRFVRPIEQLADYARDLPSHDFARDSLPLPASSGLLQRHDELGRLATSFRYMEESLHEHLLRLIDTTAAKERIESELAIAHEMQMGILKRIFPPYPDRSEIDLHAVIEPAREVGGDFYDFFFLDGQRLFFVIADVAGKGVPASLYMAMTMALLKSIARSGIPPHEVLARLNGELSRDNDACMFVTMFCAVLDSRSGELRYSNGGHNPPLILRDGVAQFLPVAHGLAPGVMEGSRYVEQRLVLEPGNILFLYTDGVTEAMNGEGEFFGEDALHRALGGDGGVQGCVGRVMAAVAAFAGNAPQADDITAMAVEFRGGQQMSL